MLRKEKKRRENSKYLAGTIMMCDSGQISAAKGQKIAFAFFQQQQQQPRIRQLPDRTLHNFRAPHLSIDTFEIKKLWIDGF